MSTVMDWVKRLRSAAHPAMLLQSAKSKVPVYCAAEQVSDLGELDRLVAVPPNFTETECVLPSFRLAGVAMLNPCSPLSPRKLPTSGRLRLAGTPLMMSVLPS